MNTIIVNGNTMDWEDGITVRTLLGKMNYSFPMLIVKINGTLIRKEEYDLTLIPVGANVAIIHLISGG
ncbi:MAG: sulfur carrier protein ThiS [Candidatus Cloacimonetes bacterium]|nr:sulfur carrier protein ThiS [Candidatus Cloacimonadota bacterium]